MSDPFGRDSGGTSKLKESDEIEQLKEHIMRVYSYSNEEALIELLSMIVLELARTREAISAVAERKGF
jgi:hypothetical protein